MALADSAGGSVQPLVRLGEAPSAPAVDWRRRAQLLAVVTVAYNLVEGLVAIPFGVAEESVALFGFGVDSLIEVASALAVLWRFRGEIGRGPVATLERERRATLFIGVLFLLLGVSVVVGAVFQLSSGEHPETTIPGVVISSVSLSFMFFLWAAKRAAARALDSRTMAGDAACSLACIQLSGVLLAGSLLYAAAPSLWWADGVAALALSALILREGVQGVRAARSPDFTGGCGCGGSCSTER